MLLIKEKYDILLILLNTQYNVIQFGARNDLDVC